MFKVSKLESGIYSILLLAGIILAALFGFYMNHSPVFLVISLILIFFATIAFYRSVATPLIYFSEDGFSIRTNLFAPSQFYEFQSIKAVRGLQSEHVLEFDRIQEAPVSLNIKHLSKKDRIRFIFLLESDVNRRHVKI